MAFGNGLTGLILASIVTLSSGAAFIICFREFFREILDIDRADVDADADVNAADVRDAVVFGARVDAAAGITARARAATESSARSDSDDHEFAPRAWESRSSYLLMVGFLGLIGIAGFVAGLTHFASKNLV